MTITFENDNDVIIYALEKVISYARRTQQIFVDQCIWWLASVIGLEQGLVNYIDNKPSRQEVNVLPEKAPDNRKSISPVPRDIQEDKREDQRLSPGRNLVHPDRLNQVEITNRDISDPDLGCPERCPPLGIINSTKAFVQKSRNERKAITKQKKIDQLSRTRLGKVIVKPLSQGQRKYLQCIPKDTIEDYLENRK
jgi:hypothetical protein